MIIYKDNGARGRGQGQGHGHDDNVAVWNGDKRAATKVRELENAGYKALHQDYSESVDMNTMITDHL